MALTGLTDQRAAEVLSDPQLLRLLSSPLGQFMPGAGQGTAAIVTRFSDVAEVLERDDVFQVGEIYAAAMGRTIGVFVLGMDDRAVHDREARFLRSAVAKHDVERIRGLVANEAEALLGAAAEAGRIDVASGFAHRIALAVVAGYFGVKGPSPEIMGRWLRGIAWEIFLNVSHRRDVTEAAVQYAGELNSHLDGEIRRLRTAFERTGEVPDHFLGRLILNQRAYEVDDDGLRRNIAGLIVGSVDTMSKTIVHAVDQLLRRPFALALASKAARAGDEDTVGACAFEALRFNPHNPIVVRHCTSDFTLAAGTERESRILAGSKVYVSTLSAMFDASVLTSPNEFRVDRPWDHYLHFGRGVHRCFGERFNRASIPQAVKSLLLGGNPRPAPRPEGRIQYEGPFPARFVVQLGSTR
jgi:cytochrome P450